EGVARLLGTETVKERPRLGSERPRRDQEDEERQTGNRDEERALPESVRSQPGSLRHPCGTLPHIGNDDRLTLPNVAGWSEAPAEPIQRADRANMCASP